MGWEGGSELKNWVSLLAGTLVVLVSAFWMLLSQDFIYGQAHAQRPILEYLTSYLVGWLAFLTVLLAVGIKKEQPSLKMILLVGFGSRLLLLPSELIQENDVYRYVLDGQVVLHKDNPYEFSPLVVSEMGSEDLRRSLERPEAELVLKRIGYPEVPTIYPPVAQLAFAAGAAIGNWNWMGQRILFLITDLLVMILLIFLLRSLSILSSWLVIYAWNPLILKEITNSAHLDVLVALFLLLSVLGFLRYEQKRTLKRLLIPAVSMGLAVLSKLYPVLLIPACLLYLIRMGDPPLRVAQFLFITGGVVAVGYLPFLSIGLSSLAAGLSTYARDWRMNDGLFSLLAVFFESPRLAASAVILLLAFLLPFLRGKHSVKKLAGDFQWILLLWFLIIPTPYPWYAVPLVALAALSPVAPASIVTFVLSGVTGLYYLSFFFEYHEFSRSWWVGTRVVEHGLIWLTLVLSLTSRAMLGQHRNRGRPTCL